MPTWAVAAVISACARAAAESACESLGVPQANVLLQVHSKRQKSEIASVTQNQEAMSQSGITGVARDGYGPQCRDVYTNGQVFYVGATQLTCSWFGEDLTRCQDLQVGQAGGDFCCVCKGGVWYDFPSLGTGECMTRQGPRGNHCYDGPSFKGGRVRMRHECETLCQYMQQCNAYEWGRNDHYNCALYIHGSTTMPQELSSSEWICNFWSAGSAGVNKISRVHDYGHSGECFKKPWGLMGSALMDA